MSKIKNLPLTFLALIFLLGGIGVGVLYSAAHQQWHPWALKQVIRFLVGFIVMLLFALTHLRRWMTYAYPSYIISLGLLIAVELMGKIGMGAQRWIDLYIITLQPSEIMKLTLLLALARYFYLTPLSDIRRFRGLIIPLLFIAIPSVLIINYILGQTEFTPLQESLADMNGDGVINILDVIQLVNGIAPDDQF